MAYKVLNTFKEKEHRNTVYNAGEIYPKGKYKPTKKRIEFLQKVHPTYGVAFLGEEIKEEKKSSDKK